jgi:NADP-dependent aldehyde dehydrogenase
MLNNIAEAIDEAADSLIAAADRETALGAERLAGEVARTSGQMRMFADVVSDGAFLGVSIDHGGAGVPELRTMMEPIGVVAVFGASNFPLAFSVPGGDTASALAAGCPVVAKAHPAHPETSELAMSAIRQGLLASEIDDAAAQIVHGFESGCHLVGEGAVHAVGFTGSESAGRSLFNAAVGRETPIPFYGELGSLNPIVVLSDVDPGAFALGLAESVSLGAGQFCTKPGLVLVPAGAAETVQATLVEALSKAGPFTMLTPSIAATYEGYITGLGGEVSVWTASVDGVGASVVSVNASQLEDHPRLLEECFGPTTVLAQYTDREELSQVLTRLPGSLTGTIHGGDTDAAAGVVDILRRRVGRIVWNGFPTGVRVAWSTHHGGPYPASTMPNHTSVGAAAMTRWLRPVAYQDMPPELLPAPLQDTNPWGVPQRIDGQMRAGSADSS